MIAFCPTIKDPSILLRSIELRRDKYRSAVVGIAVLLQQIQRSILNIDDKETEPSRNRPVFARVLDGTRWVRFSTLMTRKLSRAGIALLLREFLMELAGFDSQHR